MRMGIPNADIIKLANYRIFKMHKWQRLDKEWIIIIRVEMGLRRFNGTSSGKSNTKLSSSPGSKIPDQILTKFGLKISYKAQMKTQNHIPIQIVKIKIN